MARTSCYVQETLHASVNFSTVYVVINLQTWVVLFDYLGIGIPTPPSSPPPSPEPSEPRPFNEPSEPRPSNEPSGPCPSNEPSEPRPFNELLMTGSDHVPSVDRSLLEDALEFSSLGSDSANSLYRRAWKTLTTHNSDGTIPSVSPPEEKDPSPPVTDPLEGAEEVRSVWGVEGKMCVGVELSVKSLTVTFNKLEHPLARGNVSHVTAELKLRRGNTEISGVLGEASVVDLTETGTYYRERYLIVTIVDGY